MSLTRTEADAATDIGNQFDADSGIYANVSNLIAWNDNTQRNIGDLFTNRTPIVFNNAADTYKVGGCKGFVDTT
jgi:hypothetical protein